MGNGLIGACEKTIWVTSSGSRDSIKDSDGDFAVHLACQGKMDTVAKIKLLIEQTLIIFIK